MSAATENTAAVRIFAPDGNGGYIDVNDMDASGKTQVRERVYGNVRRIWDLKNAALAIDEHKAEVSRRVRELIGTLAEGT